MEALSNQMLKLCWRKGEAEPVGRCLHEKLHIGTLEPEGAYGGGWWLDYSPQMQLDLG